MSGGEPSDIEVIGWATVNGWHYEVMRTNPRVRIWFAPNAKYSDPDLALAGMREQYAAAHRKVTADDVVEEYAYTLHHTPDMKKCEGFTPPCCGYHNWRLYYGMAMAEAEAKRRNEAKS